MLQSMRHLAQTKVVKGLMTLLIVSFALWGIGDIFRGNPLERAVAKAGDTSITVQALNREYDAELQRARQVYGEDITSQQAKQMGLLDKTLNSMIERAEIDQAIKHLGIQVGQQTVLDKVASQPQFRDKDGKFNKEMFRQLLRQANLNENTFLRQGAQDMARQQIVDVFVPTKPPQAIVDNIYAARGQKRIFDVVMVKSDKFADIPAPDDKTLHGFYDENPQAFTAPEYRGITIARLSTDDVAKDIKISDADVQKEYDAKISELSHPERRDIQQVVLQDEAKAKKLAADARAGGHLQATAKAMGYDAVVLDQAEAQNLPPDLAKPAFVMQAGQISDPIKTSLGWHVIEVKKITPPGKPEFKDVKDSLRQTMQRDQATETVTRMVNQLDDELAAGHALEDIADTLKMRLMKIPSLDANGKTPDGRDPTELPFKVEVLKAAFAQGSGEVSPILDDKNGNYFVVRTDEISPSGVRPFDTVKDGVAAAWKADQQTKRAAEEADKIAKELREGKPLSAVANMTGVDTFTSKPISMLGDNDPALVPSILPQAFHLKKGDVATSTIPGQQIIVRLASVQDADPAKNGEAKIKIADEVRSSTRNELTEEYLKYLHTLYPVKIDRDLLDNLRQQGG